jgi:phosphatidate cytidylyltransferase
MSSGPGATFWVLLASLLVFLSVATAVGMVLKHTVAKGQPHAFIDNLHQRNLAWWGMIAVCATAFHFGLSGTVLLGLALSFLAIRELSGALPRRDADHLPLVCVSFVILPLQYLWVALGLEACVMLFVPLASMLVLPVLLLVQGGAHGALDGLTRVQWLAMTGVYAMSHVPALLNLRFADANLQPIMLVIFFTLVVQLSDVFQFIWGKLLGRRRLAPRLSPSKTVEGLIGGFVSATCVGMLLADITPFGRWQAGAMALLLCITGLLGGLVASAIKRDRGMKDWGASIGGHGGVMDRLDSVLLSAPVFFHVVRAVWSI